MFRNKYFWIASVLLVIFVGAGLSYYKFVYLEKMTSTAPSYQTTTVRRENMKVATSGVGTTIPVVEVELAFQNKGTVTELNVNVGDAVKTGDVLARQGNIDDLEAEVQSAELGLTNAQRELDDLYANADLAKAEAEQTFLNAQETLEDVEAAREYLNFTHCSQKYIDSYYADYLMALDNVKKLEEDFDKTYAFLPEDDLTRASFVSKLSAAREEYNEVYASLEYCRSLADDREKALADTAVKVAEAQLADAEETWEDLKDDGIKDAELTTAEQNLVKAKLTLAEAKTKLEDAQLVAPIDGEVTQVSTVVGGTQLDDSEPLITIAQMNPKTVQVYMDEPDLNSIKVGYKAEIVFDALPDQVITGTVTLVDPTLVTSGMSVYIRGEIILDEDSYDPEQILPAGLNASVDIISGESNNALLIPVEALRQIDMDEYAVFVFRNDQLMMQKVEIGLTDETYVEITSGLNEGETVTTGIVETF